MTSKKLKKIAIEDGCSELLSASVEAVIVNEDLMMEIFLLMPTETLIRVKCVCKDWYNIISSSNFVYNQYARNPKLASGIRFHDDIIDGWECGPLNSLSLNGNVKHVDLSFLDFEKGNTTHLEHHCNGLVLLSRWITYCVCNLTTRKYFILPEVNSNLKSAHSHHALLVFDPSSSPYCKVVLIFRKTFGSHPICIYFSETNSWWIVTVDASPGDYNSVALWDGAVHWMNETNTHFRFMVDEEKLITTQLPPKPKILKACNIRYFGECGGHLLLIQCRSPSVMAFRVLEMKRGTCCWNVKYRVNLRYISHVQPTKGYNFYVLGIVKESRESDFVMVLSTPGKLIFYNLKLQKVQLVGNFSSSEVFFKRRYRQHTLNRCFSFSENLYPVSFERRSIMVFL